MSKQAVYVGRTNQAILAGEADLSIWTDEELIRGHKRDVNGRWSGRPPKVVPKAIHDELVRRRLSKSGELLKESLLDAVTLLGTVVRDPEAQYSDRIKAASLIIDRVMGKTPERISLQVEPPWSVALRQAIQPVVLELESAEVG